MGLGRSPPGSRSIGRLLDRSRAEITVDRDFPKSTFFASYGFNNGSDGSQSAPSKLAFTKPVKPPPRRRLFTLSPDLTQRFRIDRFSESFVVTPADKGFQPGLAIRHLLSNAGFSSLYPNGFDESFVNTFIYFISYTTLPSMTVVSTFTFAILTGSMV